MTGKTIMKTYDVKLNVNNEKVFVPSIRAMNDMEASTKAINLYRKRTNDLIYVEHVDRIYPKLSILATCIVIAACFTLVLI